MSSAATNVRLATPSIFTRTFMLGIMGTLSMYLTSWENSDRVRDNYLDKHRDYGDTFDFIIVGGGTAGSILANRLSEDYKVLMLEAGGDPHPFQRVPLLSNWLLQYSQLDWKHITMPQKQAFKGSTQSRASISQGRGLGGTSNLDYMMYLRGHPKDFDEWADLTKDSSWSYDSVLKYFKSLEQYSGPWEGEYHGDSGEMRIKRPAYTGLGERFCHAAQQNGYPQVDLNGPFVEGCDILTYPTKKGYRDSVHSSFLRKIKDHWNLAIHKYAHVNKILIKGDENRAKGVEYDRHGKAQVAYATKEIIVTAGAIQTAKILMLSGIGQRAELDSLGIPVIADLPVGKRLQDHLSVYLGPFFVDTGASLDIDRDVSAGAALSLARDNGPLTTTGFQAAAVISSGLEKLHGGRNWPDLQLTMYGLSHHKSADEDFSHAYHLKKDLLKTYFEHSKGSDSFSIVVSGGRPKSSGTVKLLNRNPYAPLIINPNYFDKVYDLVVMVDGVKKAIRLVENSTVFHDINARLTNEVLPGCETFRFRSDAYWECYVKTMSVSFGNVAGTAAMGSVVDSNMRVIGLKGLRVMDASIMPSIVSTSTGAAVMMIAEKGADLLLKQWQGTQTEGGLLKDTNLVLTKIKENASKMKGTIDSSKAFLETLKLAGSNPDAALEQIDMEDLKKLTQSVGSLAAILGPGAVPRSKSYTGSNGLGKNSSLAALMALSPMLKGQVGGLYQNVFDDTETQSSIASPVSVKPQGKGENLLNSFKIPLLSKNTTGKSQPANPTNNLNLIRILQGMMKNKINELKNITKNVKTSPSEQSKTPGKGATPTDITLEDVFGLANGGQEELEEYSVEESLLLPPTTTQKIAKSTTQTTTTSKPTTTTERPMIEYAYEVIHQGPATPKQVPIYPEYLPEATRPPLLVYPKSNPFANLKTLEANVGSLMTPELQKFKNLEANTDSLRTSELQKFKNLETITSLLRNSEFQKFKNLEANVGSQQTPESQKFKNVEANVGSQKTQESQKFKNLEALAQIQHDTITKFNEKQRQKHLDSARLQLPFQPRQPNPLASIQNPQFSQNAPPPLYQYPLSSTSQTSFSQPPPPVQSYTPPENILPPPFHRQPPSPSYDQIRRPQSHPFPPLPPQFGQDPITERPFGFIRPYNQELRPSVDPTDLKYAVGSIINAKYTHPTPNPFRGVLDYRGHPPPTDFASEGVLKALQLRANVDKYLNFPILQTRPSPIPITHRPTYPPPPPTTTETPVPPPVPYPDMEDAGIFAPIKDALQPLTKLMKAPFDLLPTFANPFKKESSSESSSSSFLPQLPSLFQHRAGPMPSDSSEVQTPQPIFPPSPSQYAQLQPSSPTVRDSLAAVLPRFFVNHSRKNEEISPELFLLTLANLTSDLPKPFVLEPSKSLRTEGVASQPFLSSSTLSEKDEQRNKKLLDQSISEILSHLKNHHFASIASNPDSDSDDPVESSKSGINSANEILNIQYTKVPTTVKSSVPATPKINNNPPIEFHKSAWAKEPAIPSKSLHFKIKIIK